MTTLFGAISVSRAAIEIVTDLAEIYAGPLESREKAEESCKELAANRAELGRVSDHLGNALFIDVSSHGADASADCAAPEGEGTRVPSCFTQSKNAVPSGLQSTARTYSPQDLHEPQMVSREESGTGTKLRPLVVPLAELRGTHWPVDMLGVVLTLGFWHLVL